MSDRVTDDQVKVLIFRRLKDHESDGLLTDERLPETCDAVRALVAAVQTQLEAYHDALEADRRRPDPQWHQKAAAIHKKGSALLAELNPRLKELRRRQSEARRADRASPKRGAGREAPGFSRGEAEPRLAQRADMHPAWVYSMVGLGS